MFLKPGVIGLDKDIPFIVSSRVTPILEAMGIELYDIEYRRERSGFVLRLFIDKTDGVGLDDCENVSREVAGMLDDDDPIDVSYSLEVSSPGIERKLIKDLHYLRYTGEKVEVKLHKPVDGKKKYGGRLVCRENGCVKIDCGEGNIMEFDVSNVSSCKLIHFN